jgi:nicotinate-nucleotide pyrophosphorylase (carboxylating)
VDVPRDVIRRLVANALDEDIGQGDLTTLSAIDADSRAEADVVFREPGVVAGLAVVEDVFTTVEPSLRVELLVADGANVDAGAVVAHIAGSARGILSGERVALNFIQRMSGIATLTARYVAAIGDLPTRLLDTRKTTPGLRVLEKYAVRTGGAVNHRYGLYDGVMFKDNHLAILAAGGVDLSTAIRRVRASVGPMVRIEVEVEDVDGARRAAEAGADMILLDNMEPEAMREAVAVVNGRAKLEASGGITLDTLRAVAETGIDYISSGALTHSARALDIGLDMHAS